MYYVYILKLKNRQFYVGFTRNLRLRFKRHNQNAIKTTARLKIDELVFYAAFKSKVKALNFEKYLKSSSGFSFRNKRLI